MRKEGDMGVTQVAGLLLWRGGLALTGAAALFEAARWVLFFFDLPVALCVGLGLIIAGMVLVFISLLCEQVEDNKKERLNHE